MRSSSESLCPPGIQTCQSHGTVSVSVPAPVKFPTCVPSPALTSTSLSVQHRVKCKPLDPHLTFSLHRASYYEISVDDGPWEKQKSSGLSICTGTGSKAWYIGQHARTHTRTRTGIRSNGLALLEAWFVSRSFYLHVLLQRKDLFDVGVCALRHLSQIMYEDC